MIKVRFGKLSRSRQSDCSHGQWQSQIYQGGEKGFLRIAINCGALALGSEKIETLG